MPLATTAQKMPQKGSFGEISLPAFLTKNLAFKRVLELFPVSLNNNYKPGTSLVLSAKEPFDEHSIMVFVIDS